MSRSRTWPGALLATLTLVLGLAIPASAAPNTEISLAVVFDGTADFDAASTGSSPNAPDSTGSSWDAGLDDGPNNGIVRTFDRVGYRIDWNVNEAAGTNVVITASLPEIAATDAVDITWLELPEGCLTDPPATPVSSITNKGLDLTCNLGNFDEGAAGSIFPIAVVNGSLDGTELALSADITTDATGTVTSNTVRTTVSARPTWNWVMPQAEDGDPPPVQINNVIDGVDGATPGRIYIFPLGLKADGTGRGAEPLATTTAATPVEFVQDLSLMFPGARLLDFPHPSVATACGPLENAPAGMPLGVPTAAGATPTNVVSAPGVWSCTPHATAPHALQISVHGFDTKQIPTDSLGGSNPGYAAVGQVAIFVPEADLIANAQTPGPPSWQGSLYSRIGSWDGVSFNGDGSLTLGPVTDGMLGESGAPNVPEPTADNESRGDYVVTDVGTRFTWVRFQPTIDYLLRRTTAAGVYDVMPLGSTGGLTGTPHDGEGERGVGHTMRATLYAWNGLSSSAHVNSCMALDTLNVTVSDFENQSPTIIDDATDLAVGSFDWDQPMQHSQGVQFSADNETGPESSLYLTRGVDYEIEYTDGASATPASTSTEPTCNNSDAGPGGWQSDPSIFEDALNPGTYPSVVKVRVRTLRPMTAYERWTTFVGLTALDPTGNARDTVYVHRSTSWSEWDWTVDDAPPEPWFSNDYDPTIEADGAFPEFDETGTNTTDRMTVTLSGGTIAKTVAPGQPATFRRGDLITYVIDAAGVGADGDVQTGVRVHDNFDPAELQYVSSTPPADVVGGANIYWHPDDLGSSGNAAAQSATVPWDHTYEVTFRVIGGDDFASFRNRARVITTNRGNTRYSEAWAQIGGPYLQGTVDKFVPDATTQPLHVQPCTNGDPDCQMIDRDSNMSFELNFTNAGTDTLSNVRIIDVLPHLADETEPAEPALAGTPAPGTGDGRTPESDFAGVVDFVSLTGGSGSETVWYTAADPATVNRDPNAYTASTGADFGGAATWCALADFGSGGSCPAGLTEVTAIYIEVGDVDVVDNVRTYQLLLDTTGNQGGDIYTNTFGARTDDIAEQIRSNDVSIMVTEADVELNKTLLTDAPFAVGDTVQFEIEVENLGPDDATNVTVTDFLPVGLAYSGDDAGGVASDPDATPGSGDETVEWDFDRLGVNSPETITLDVTITADAVGTLTNYVEVTALDQGDVDSSPDDGELVDHDGDPDTPDIWVHDPPSDDNPPDEDDEASASLEVTYDLALAKVVVADTEAGELTYTIRIANQGGANSGTVEITDAIPAGLTYVSDDAAGILDDPDATPGSGDETIVWTLSAPADELAPGDTRDIQLVVAIDDLAQSPFVNSVEITDDRSTEESGNLDEDSTPNSLPGDPVVEMTDLKDGTTDDLLDPAVDSDDHDQATWPAPYDLALVKTVDSVDWETDEVTFNIRVQNQGQLGSGEVGVTDSIPAGLGYVSDTAGGTLVDPDTTPGSGDELVTWAIPDIAAGEFVDVQVVMSILDIAQAPFVNDASITSSFPDEDSDPADDNTDVIEALDPADAIVDELDGDTDDHDISTWDPRVDVDLTKQLAVGQDPEVSLGDTVSYVLTIRNEGPHLATGITVQDYIPEGMSFVSASDGGTHDADVVTWEIDVVPDGKPVTVSLELRVDENGDHLNFAEVTATDQPDADSSPAEDELGLAAAPNEDDEGFVAVSSEAIIDLELSKEVAEGAPTEVSIDDEVEFRITVVNKGPSDATTVTVEDRLPAGLKYVSDDADGTVTGSSITWTTDALPVDTPWVIGVTAKVVSLDELTNVAEVIATAETDLDSQPGENDQVDEDEEDTAVLAAAASTPTDTTDPGSGSNTSPATTAPAPTDTTDPGSGSNTGPTATAPAPAGPLAATPTPQSGLPVTGGEALALATLALVLIAGGVVSLRAGRQHVE